MISIRYLINKSLARSKLWLLCPNQTISLCLTKSTKIQLMPVQDCTILLPWRNSPIGQGLLIIEDSWLHSDTLQSVGLLWTSDQPDAETSTWQPTTLKRDKTSMPLARFEPAIPTGERPQTHASDRAAPGTRKIIRWSYRKSWATIFCKVTCFIIDKPNTPP